MLEGSSGDKRSLTATEVTKDQEQSQKVSLVQKISSKLEAASNVSSRSTGAISKSTDMSAKSLIRPTKGIKKFYPEVRSSHFRRILSISSDSDEHSSPIFKQNSKKTSSNNTRIAQKSQIPAKIFSIDKFSRLSKPSSIGSNNVLGLPSDSVKSGTDAPKPRYKNVTCKVDTGRSSLAQSKTPLPRGTSESACTEKSSIRSRTFPSTISRPTAVNNTNLDHDKDMSVQETRVKRFFPVPEIQNKLPSVRSKISHIARISNKYEGKSLAKTGSKDEISSLPLAAKFSGLTSRPIRNTSPQSNIPVTSTPINKNRKNTVEGASPEDFKPVSPMKNEYLVKLDYQNMSVTRDVSLEKARPVGSRSVGLPVAMGLEQSTRLPQRIGTTTLTRNRPWFPDISSPDERVLPVGAAASNEVLAPVTPLSRQKLSNYLRTEPTNVTIFPQSRPSGSPVKLFRSPEIGNDSDQSGLSLISQRPSSSLKLYPTRKTSNTEKRTEELIETFKRAGPRRRVLDTTSRGTTLSSIPEATSRDLNHSNAPTVNSQQESTNAERPETVQGQDAHFWWCVSKRFGRVATGETHSSRGLAQHPSSSRLVQHDPDIHIRRASSTVVGPQTVSRNSSASGTTSLPSEATGLRSAIPVPIGFFSPSFTIIVGRVTRRPQTVLEDGGKTSPTLSAARIKLTDVLQNTVRYKYNINYSTEECTICLLFFRRAEDVRRLPCMHLFHRSCIDKWLLIKAVCPTCNSDLCLPCPKY